MSNAADKRDVTDPRIGDERERPAEIYFHDVPTQGSNKVIIEAAARNNEIGALERIEELEEILGKVREAQDENIKFIAAQFERIEAKLDRLGKGGRKK